MFNSSEMNFPLNLPFELILSPENDEYLPVQALGYYDVKFLFLRKGTLSAELDGSEISLSAGDLLVICPDVAFRLTSGPCEERPVCEMVRMDPYLVNMPPYTAGFKAILKEAGLQRMEMRIPAEEVNKWQAPENLEACFRENQEMSFGWETGIQARLQQICVSLVRYWMENGLKVPVQAENEDPIYSITAYIYRHIQDGIRIEELATRCNLSYPWFAKKFREIFGVSCKDYVERVRVARVSQYLLHTEWDLTEISEATGYADCSHMIKNFKRLKNTTPGQYRLKA